MTRMHNSIIPFNSSPPSAAYMRRLTGWALVQVMACRLFDAKPLFEPMLEYFNWTLGYKLQCNFFIEIRAFSFKEMLLKMASAKQWPFCPGRDQLIKQPLKFWNEWVIASYALIIKELLIHVLIPRLAQLISVDVWHVILFMLSFHIFWSALIRSSIIQMGQYPTKIKITAIFVGLSR